MIWESRKNRKNNRIPNAANTINSNIFFSLSSVLKNFITNLLKKQKRECKNGAPAEFLLFHGSEQKFRSVLKSCSQALRGTHFLMFGVPLFYHFSLCIGQKNERKSNPAFLASGKAGFVLYTAFLILTDFVV